VGSCKRGPIDARAVFVIMAASGAVTAIGESNRCYTTFPLSITVPTIPPAAECNVPPSRATTLPDAWSSAGYQQGADLRRQVRRWRGNGQQLVATGMAGENAHIARSDAQCLGHRAYGGFGGRATDRPSVDRDH
jgi:hypothetical protein